MGFLLVALVVATYFGATFGVQTALLALVIAVVPLGIVIPTFLWLDRFESEPTRYLVGAFLWGALVAAVLAALFNTSAIAVLEATTDPEAALATTAVLIAPVAEEALKGVLVLLVWLFLRHEFDGITDGMVYAGVCAAGFAFTENMQYLAVAWSEGGGEALTATFVARCVMSPFAHPMFTVLTGIGIGVAATSRTWMPRLVAPVAGFVLAVLAHALWNLAAVSGGQGVLVVYLLVEVPVFLAFLGFVAWTRRHEGHLIGQFLRPTPTPGGSRPRRSRCSRRCPIAARRVGGPARTPAAPGSPRCAGSRTPPASWPCSAGGCTTPPPTSTPPSRSVSSSTRCAGGGWSSSGRRAAEARGAGRGTTTRHPGIPSCGCRAPAGPAASDPSTCLPHRHREDHP